MKAGNIVEHMVDGITVRARIVHLVFNDFDLELLEPLPGKVIGLHQSNYGLRHGKFADSGGVATLYGEKRIRRELEDAVQEVPSASRVEMVP